MRFFVARHAATEWNQAGRVQGRTDIPLSSQGRLDAGRLAVCLYGRAIDYIVSSPLERALETAQYIQRLIHAPLIVDKRLMECAFGELEGLTRQQIAEKYPALFGDAWWSQCGAYDFRPYGGESRNDVLFRHKDFLQEMCMFNAKRHPLLVGHGRGLRTLLDDLGYRESRLGHADYCVIEYNI